jgi:RimJ/RimL family protein N-acetyltransferase
MTQVPTLETERLLLRPWHADDAKPFSEMCADADLMRFVGGVMDRPAAWRRMAAYAGQWSLRGYGPWALQDKATGALAGYSGVFNPDGWPEPEINWGLVRSFLGRGLITEAAARARDYAYDTLGFTTIASCIDLENKASIAVATRLGAKLDREIMFFGRPGGIFRHLAPTERHKLPNWRF